MSFWHPVSSPFLLTNFHLQVSMLVYRSLDLWGKNHKPLPLGFRFLPSFEVSRFKSMFVMMQHFGQLDRWNLINYLVLLLCLLFHFLYSSHLLFPFPFVTQRTFCLLFSHLLPSFFCSVACNDLVASGRDRKPNALVQVAVIDPHKQHLVFHACTEIVEVRPHTHTQSSLSLMLTFGVHGFASSLGHWVLVCVLSIFVPPPLSQLFFFAHLTHWSGKDNER